MEKQGKTGNRKKQENSIEIEKKSIEKRKKG